ncbi:hypothetical protein MACH07_15490 [Flagellimonas marinaquae]|uniref:Signal transduction histidine kinase internal region domain-containing protein n=1 Tax=Flagellimonas marinaquae TaxID=254955 RepID=A0AA48KL45_9FLAO|nr:hypothetical protein MACH07_15490 [Allomuricauda aquimarina]
MPYSINNVLNTKKYNKAAFLLLVTKRFDLFKIKFNSTINPVLLTWVFFVLWFISPLQLITAQQISDDREVTMIQSSYLKDQSNLLEIEDILQHDYSFTPFTTNPIDNLDATYWIRLDLKKDRETLCTQKQWSLRSPSLSEATLFSEYGDEIEEYKFGKFNSTEKQSSLLYNNGAPFDKEGLFFDRYLYVKIKTYFPVAQPLKFHYLPNVSNRFYTDYYTDMDLRTIAPSLYYLGACSMICIMFLVIYFTILKTEFLFYSLYVLFSIIYLAGNNVPELYIFFNSKYTFWINVISQIFINLFYLIFAKLYLNTKKNYTFLNSIINIVIAVLIVLIILHFIAYFLSYYQFQDQILDVQRGFMTIWGLFSMTYLAFKYKDSLVIFIVLGSFIYMIGALAYLFSGDKNYMMTGLIIEILIFSLGLGYKIKLDYMDRLNLQKEVFSKEIVAKQAQMNPHFIFNSLSSIQHLIIQNDKMSALNYLSKFSKLTRNVLESSHLTTVTLDEEISVIKSYLELESLRFDSSFQYRINVAENLDTENVNIPLMLVQPFVENALIHGLIGKKEGKKEVEIRIYNKDGFCVIEVEDNGVGRHNKNRVLNKTGQKSRGMQITQKRLQLLNNGQPNKNTVEIVDKYDANSQSKGTKVILKIHNP